MSLIVFFDRVSLPSWPYLERVKSIFKEEDGRDDRNKLNGKNASWKGR